MFLVLCSLVWTLQKVGAYLETCRSIFGRKNANSSRKNRLHPFHISGNWVFNQRLPYHFVVSINVSKDLWSKCMKCWFWPKSLLKEDPCISKIIMLSLSNLNDNNQQKKSFMEVLLLLPTFHIINMVIFGLFSFFLFWKILWRTKNLML